MMKSRGRSLRTHGFESETKTSPTFDRSRPRLFYILAALALLIYAFKSQSEIIQQYNYFDFLSTTVETKREPRLGDGCYHVFLDVGANVGVHGRFLLEPQKYPKSPKSVPLFKKEYGLIDNRNICVFEFEPNAKHWSRLHEISAAYTKMGWRYHVVEAAVSDRNGSETFFHQGKEDEKYNEWGFSGANEIPTEDGYSVEVLTIRLGEWIQTHIHERIVPEMQDRPPILGMKMDIEGHEYRVLPDTIHTGAICDFDFVFGEFHPQFLPSKHLPELKTRSEAEQFTNAIQKIIEGSRNCKVRWYSIDDESYLKDGQPLPTPS